MARAAWFDGPIAAPRFSPRQSPRPLARPYTALDTWAQGHTSVQGFDHPRPTQLKDLYYNTITSKAIGDQANAIRFWDSFVAKQNSRAGMNSLNRIPRSLSHLYMFDTVDTLTQYSAAYQPHRPHSQLLSPRSQTPRALPPLAATAAPLPHTAASELLSPRPPNYWNKPGPPTTYRKARPGSLGSRQKPARYLVSANEGAAPTVITSDGAVAAAGPAYLTRRQLEQLVTSSEDALNQRFSDMWAAFKYVDVDSSGRVNREELARALHLWGVNNPHGDLIQAADAVIRACDTDGDGSVDYKEFVAGLARDKFIGASHAAPALKKRNIGDPVPSRDSLTGLPICVSSSRVSACVSLWRVAR